jgi:hypothetical protein
LEQQGKSAVENHPALGKARYRSSDFALGVFRFADFGSDFYLARMLIAAIERDEAVKGFI